MYFKTTKQYIFLKTEYAIGDHRDYSLRVKFQKIAFPRVNATKLKYMFVHNSFLSTETLGAFAAELYKLVPT